MKKVLIGFILAISLSVIGGVSSGGLITADLINKILEMPLVDAGENSCSTLFIRSGSAGSYTYSVENTSCPSAPTLTIARNANNDQVDGDLDLSYSSLSLSQAPSVIVTSYHYGGGNAFASATYRNRPTNTGVGFYLRSPSGGFAPTYFHVTLERMNSDRFGKLSIKDLILQDDPNYFNLNP